MTSRPRTAHIITLSFVFAFSAIFAAAQGPYRISGIVVNGINDSPVAKCQLAVRNENPEADPRALKTFTGTSDTSGHFTFDNLSAGKYALSARCSHFAAQNLDEHEGFASAVAVGPDKDSTNIVFRLAPTASITGRIVDEFGDPVIDAGVMLFRRSTERGNNKPQLRTRANTDHGGFYHFFRLPPGEYLIAVIAHPWYFQYQQPVDLSKGEPTSQVDDGEADLDLTFPITYYSAATESSSAQPIKLQPGDRVTADMVLATQHATQIWIPLAQSDDESVRHNTVHELQASIFGAPVNVFSMTSTMNNGKVDVIRGVAQGDYTVQERNFTISQNGIPSRPAGQSLQQVKVSSAGAEFKQTVEGTPVTGSVEMEGIRGALRETVIRFQKDGVVVDARTGPSGAMEPFHLFPGLYEYSAFSQQGVIKSLEATGAKVVGRNIEITNKPVTFKVTLADVATKITGTVRGPDGKPFHGAMVILVPEDIEHNQIIMRRDQSDMDGTFTLRVVMPGRYKLLALQDAWDAEWSNPRFLAPFLASAPVIEVPPNSQPLNIEVKSQPTHR